MEHREFVHHADGEELSCTTIRPDGEERAERVVLMHGAGGGSKERNLPLARDFAAAGCPSLAFDFSGHGGSSGELSALSLERRFRQARSVIDEFAPDGQPLVLVGFSMSGQTVADLIHDLGSRVAAICLAAPAAFTPDAWTVPFGPGFTELIRRPGSWEASEAFDIYGEFAGRAVLVVPERDEVIPPGVTRRIEDALRQKSEFAKLVIDGADHMLGLWFADHPDDRSRLVGLCIGGSH